MAVLTANVHAARPIPVSLIARATFVYRATALREGGHSEEWQLYLSDDAKYLNPARTRQE